MTKTNMWILILMLTLIPVGVILGVSWVTMQMQSTFYVQDGMIYLPSNTS